MWGRFAMELQNTQCKCCNLANAFRFPSFKQVTLYSSKTQPQHSPPKCPQTIQSKPLLFPFFVEFCDNLKKFKRVKMEEIAIATAQSLQSGTLDFLKGFIMGFLLGGILTSALMGWALWFAIKNYKILIADKNATIKDKNSDITELKEEIQKLKREISSLRINESAMFFKAD